MSELRARTRVLYNALNFDTPVNFGQEELFAKGLGKTTSEMNNVGQTERHLGSLEAGRTAYREKPGYHTTTCRHLSRPASISTGSGVDRKPEW
jgi:hypothetical protein